MGAHRKEGELQKVKSTKRRIKLIRENDDDGRRQVSFRDVRAVPIVETSSAELSRGHAVRDHDPSLTLVIHAQA